MTAITEGSVRFQIIPERASGRIEEQNPLLEANSHSLPSRSVVLHGTAPISATGKSEVHAELCANLFYGNSSSAADEMSGSGGGDDKEEDRKFNLYAKCLR